MVVQKNEMLRFFSQTIEKETGIVYADSNAYLLESRLKEFAESLGYGTLDLLWTDVRKRGLKANEKSMILDLSTNNETSFFRDQEVFDFFRNEFLGKRFPHGKVRIWCAACSTGQEPYSLALLFDHMRAQGAARDYEILASDFSQRALGRAQAGIYTQLEVQRGLAPAMLQSTFDTVSVEESHVPRYKIKDRLRQNMTFQHLNLLADWPHQTPFNIIFCRNVLIYQDVSNKKRVIERLAKLLTPGGYLVLGGAESLVGLSTLFQTEVYGKACVYRLK